MYRLLFNYWQSFIISDLLGQIVMIIIPILGFMFLSAIWQIFNGNRHIQNQNDEIIRELKKINRGY